MVRMDDELEKVESKGSETERALEYFFECTEELEKVEDELNRIGDAIAEAKQGYVSRKILPKEMLNEVFDEINAKALRSRFSVQMYLNGPNAVCIMLVAWCCGQRS